MIDTADHKEVPILPDQADARLAKFWKNNVKRAFKQIPSKTSPLPDAEDKNPNDIWDRATKRLEGKGSDNESGLESQPYVNEYRKLIESELSYFDQQEPAFKVVADEQFLTQDPQDAAAKRAECVSAYLKKIWREQKCQKAESRKLIDACNLNIGFTMPDWEPKKMMPYIRYLPARHVGIDPDCNGNIEEANWISYKEWISLETFKGFYPKVPKEILQRIGSGAKNNLSKEDLADLGDDVSQMHQSIEVTHIFARNAGTQGPRKEINDEYKGLPEEVVLERRYFTPRRYIVLVEGYEGTILDNDKWAYELDHDELPITPLQFNVVNNDIYGYTDYVHMERLDDFGDKALNYIQYQSREAAITKYGTPSNFPIKKEDIDDFLSNPQTSVLEGLVDGEGNQLVRPLEREPTHDWHVKIYPLIKQETADSSALHELMAFHEAQQYKDVTALAARILEANAHQKVNRRLNGPWGYEQSITEDAIKLLEIAFEEVPQYSELRGVRALTDETTGAVTYQQETLPPKAWEEARQWLIKDSSLWQAGGWLDVQLYRLGVDAIVGPDLAQYWPSNEHILERRLMLKISVEPGSSRSITRLEQAAVLKQLYVEVFLPFYEGTGRRDLQREYLEMLGQIAGVPNLDAKLPSRDELRQQQLALQNAAQNIPGEAGGQPLNSPEANVAPQYQEAGLG